MIESRRRPVIDPSSPVTDIKRAVACTYKKAYQTIEEATAVAKKLRKTIGPKTRPYKCSFCVSFHLGHRRSKKKIQTLQSSSVASN